MLARLVLLAGIQEALPLQHDESLAVDRLVQVRLRQQRLEMRDCLGVKLQRIQAQAQAPAGQVRLGMVRVLFEESLELGNRHRVKLPIVGGAGYEIRLQHGIIHCPCGERNTRNKEQKCQETRGGLGESMAHRL